jgi:hypothetical protein
MVMTKRPAAGIDAPLQALGESAANLQVRFVDL